MHSRLTSIAAAFALTTLGWSMDAAAGTEAIGDPVARQLRDDVETVLKRTGTPGATVLVSRNGTRIFDGGFGIRNREEQLPARLDTHYEIGSITKQFTAAAILQLRDAGKLDIDAKVSAYLPDIPHAKEVTLRQLLTHSSGIPDYFGLISDEAATKPTTFDGLMGLVAGRPLDFPPGSGARYSNTGFMILGRVIEVVSHETYSAYIQKHLLTPAGMTETFTVPDESSLTTMAVGYRHREGQLVRGLTIHDSFSGAAGDLVSTVGDLEKWNQALMGGKIVPKSDYALMKTPQLNNGGEDTHYGMGLFLDTSYDQPRIGHTGGTFDFTSANFYYPEQKLRIIVLTNDRDDPEPGEIIANAIFADLYPDYARAASRGMPGEETATTVKAKAAFHHLQLGTADESLFAPSLNQKLGTQLGKQMAARYAPYGEPTAFVFKGQRARGDKSWSDYRVEFGPGSTINFSIALDESAKVLSLGFDNF